MTAVHRLLIMYIMYIMYRLQWRELNALGWSWEYSEVIMTSSNDV
jgi:hypothetical protein